MLILTPMGMICFREQKLTKKTVHTAHLLSQIAYRRADKPKDNRIKPPKDYQKFNLWLSVDQSISLSLSTLFVATKLYHSVITLGHLIWTGI